MLISLRPKSITSLPHLSAASPLKWVSTATTQNPEDHLRLFFKSRTNQTHIDYERQLVSVLKSCATLSALLQGQQLHSLVLKSGLDSNTFINNSLISMYAKCGSISCAESLFGSCSEPDPVSCNIMVAGYVKSGDLDNARQVFDKMPERGCVSYTTMIMGLSRNGFWREAVAVFRDMRNAGVLPNELTMGTVISTFSHLGGIWNCRMLHGLVVKLQLDGMVLVSTNLVKVYCACKSVWEARSLFDEMPERNIVSWNVMLNGYSKAGLVHLARELFERIDMKDVVSWGTMIDGYVQVECLNEALMMYRAMLRAGLGPNDVMLVDLISVCGRLEAIREGRQFHGRIVKEGFDCYDFIQATIINFYAGCGEMIAARLQFEKGIKEHVASWNALIAGYIRNQMIDQASLLFDEMPERDVFSWSSMISGYTQTEQSKLALELFQRMVSSGIQPNEITMVSVLSAITDLGTLKEGIWAHEYICENSIPLNDNLSAAIIDMYAKCGSINTALKVFYQIQDKTSSVSPWNAIICGLALHGHAAMSLEIFSDLQRRDIKLNSITFIGVLSACCHSGLVEAGERYFKSMKNVYHIQPNIKHYGCMVDLLGRAGRVEDAEKMIRSMPMKADVVIWGTLLAACTTHGNLEIGEMAEKNLKLLDPSHGASTVLMSNLLADAGKWEEASLERRVMQSLRLTRSPGHSDVVW
ncbi:putative tetratricopeptide-like helical domain-containing protein [Rosa chinensis]|uniref:Putative tetratricopeptide-like helical domain-containing protein n=1 Tax=Rosa chinensis TaxID=74649 RepID=A0A2P6QXG1_ROSCH|nr:pentatricopeptide repeat-containing protein At5g19020, mitochondrial [Rosa chinensis]XP_040374526.1 pentatricopeptide repeat-containing protein At5g19020, mitochondrial [Rosa chinensis]PRQ38870.1 putative tetratricopeptide-like helical domain-containing protein [Rosa chinensis]